MIYGSICSGIEAATAAWEALGWKAAWFSEIEPFPCALLQNHYPDTPNLGDMTKIHERTEFNDTAIDVLIGGTPCQSFSVAGLRKGMADPRGNLALTFLSIVDRKRPRWVVWENVPGVLSSNGGRDFGAFIGGLAELGYGVAWRILDAQHFGVPQRRRRVFVVGYIGDWRPATAVLFERHSLSGDTPPSREKRKDIAACLEGCTPGSRQRADKSDNLILDTVAACLRSGGDGGVPSSRGENLIVTCYENHASDSRIKEVGDIAPVAYAFDSLASNSMKSSNPNSGCNEVDISKTVDTRGLNPSCNQGGNAVLQSSSCNHEAPIIAFTQNMRNEVRDLRDCAGALGANEGMKQRTYLAIPIHDQATRFKGRNGEKTAGKGNGLGIGSPGDPMATLTKGDRHAIQRAGSVRRLTPMECERLQGFPDGHTSVPFRGKPSSDSVRYKALGNSMAVPVIFWLGSRIQKVEDIL